MALFEHFPYTNFHELNAEWLMKTTKELTERVDDAESRLDSVESRLDTAEEDIVSIEADIVIIKADIVSAKSRLTSLESRMTTAEGDITSLKTRVTSAESRLTSVENAVTALTTRVGTAEGNITALQAREQIPAHTASDNGKMLTVNSSNQLGWGIPAGAGLPAISSGDAGKVLTVNASEDGSEWAWIKAIYIDLGDTFTSAEFAAIIDQAMSGVPVYARYIRANPVIPTNIDWLDLFPAYQLTHPITTNVDDSHGIEFSDVFHHANSYFSQSYTGICTIRLKVENDVTTWSYFEGT